MCERTDEQKLEEYTQTNRVRSSLVKRQKNGNKKRNKKINKKNLKQGLHKNKKSCIIIKTLREYWGHCKMVLIKGGFLMQIRAMKKEDYSDVFTLWKSIEGFGIRTIDDSEEGITRFLERNPTTSVVAEEDGKIIGSILCGHDGRTGCFYHVCVERTQRNRGIATKMVQYALEALKKEKVSKVSLVAFSENETGNACWHELGWIERRDLNCYDYILNENNIVVFNEKK